MRSSLENPFGDCSTGNIDAMLNLTSPVRQREHELNLNDGSQRFKRNS